MAHYFCFERSEETTIPYHRQKKPNHTQPPKTQRWSALLGCTNHPRLEDAPSISQQKGISKERLKRQKAEVVPKEAEMAGLASGSWGSRWLHAMLHPQPYTPHLKTAQATQMEFGGTSVPAAGTSGSTPSNKLWTEYKTHLFIFTHQLGEMKTKKEIKPH